MIRLSCGMTPEHCTFRQKISAYPASETTPFLDARAARVVDADHRAAELRREVHHLADLLGEDLGEAAAEDREVLREDEDLAAEDRPVAGDDRVAVGTALEHPEVRLTVADVAVELHERSRVEQPHDPLAGEELARLAVLRNCLLVAGVKRLVAKLAQARELPLCRVLGLRPLVGRGHVAERTPELVAQSHKLRLPVALADRCCSFGDLVRVHEAAEERLRRHVLDEGAHRLSSHPFRHDSLALCEDEPPNMHVAGLG